MEIVGGRKVSFFIFFRQLRDAAGKTPVKVNYERSTYAYHFNVAKIYIFNNTHTLYD